MPLPGFVSDATLQTALENVVKVPAGTFSGGDSAGYAQTIHDANVSAYQEIQGALLRRGITQAQLDLWDRGAEYQRHIGLYRCLIEMADLARDIPPGVLKGLNRVEELRTVELYAGGVPMVPPTPPSEGLVTTGALDTSRDVFVPDARAPWRGQVTRW